MLTGLRATNRLVPWVHLGRCKNVVARRQSRKFRYVDSGVGDFYTPVAPEHTEGLNR